MEAADVMSLPEGILIVFWRGLRYIVHDSRKVVFTWLHALAPPPEVITAERPKLALRRWRQLSSIPWNGPD
jgi:hypothetical protein